jgi:lysophospholipase L1-like esterase
MADPHNEGHPRAIVSEIANYTKPSIPEQPNLVLLMAGVNDINRNTDLAGAPGRLAALVEQIFEVCEETTVVVAQLTPYPSKQGQVDDFNKAMAPLINQKISSGRHIVIGTNLML